MSHHYCHATHCNIPVPPTMFMCKAHWLMLLKELRDEIWTHYRPGQEFDKRPSPEYLSAVAKAVAYVSAQEVLK